MIHTKLTDQYDQRSMWADSAGEALSKVVSEIDDSIINKIIKEAETSDTNNSLMLYTSGTNNMQIVEDRTMTTQEKLNKVEENIASLHSKVNGEARIHNGLLLRADVNPYNGLPKNNNEFLSDAWRAHSKMIDQAVDRIRKGLEPEGAEISVTPIPSMFGYESVRMTNELFDAVSEFEDYIEETYAIPLMKLNRERDALRKMQSAERQLEDKTDTLEAIFGF